MKASLAATSGVHGAEDVLKVLLAGADAAMQASALSQRGPGLIGEIEAALRRWLEEREYESVEQMKGSVSQGAVGRSRGLRARQLPPHAPLLVERASALNAGPRRARSAPHVGRAATSRPASGAARARAPWLGTCTRLQGGASGGAMGFIRSFDSLTLDDIPIVGGKNASFGEMIRELQPLGVRVPDGFALTAEAYQALLEGPGVRDQLRAALRGIDLRDVDSLRTGGALARRAVREAPVPPELQRELEAAYAALSRKYGEEATDVAVRSSATAEDLPTASFAGQQETYLNVHGAPLLVDACRKCFASLFTDRAISYRAERGFDHEKVYLSIGVQKMVRSDLAGSGVLFTLDTESGFDGVVFITAIYGLGENIVQGVVNPDEYIVFKPTLRGDLPAARSKEIAMVYDEGGGRAVRNVPVPEALRRQFVLTREETIELARYAIAIEKHYSARAGEPRPMDIEWAKDGRSGELFIVQARPETTHSQRDTAKLVSYRLKQRAPVRVRGRAVGKQIGAGPVARLDHASQMHDFRPGSVLVTAMTDPDWEPILKQASAIVTDRGGRTCHAAIVRASSASPASSAPETPRRCCRRAIR